VAVTLRRRSAARPVLLDPRDPVLRAAARAYRRGYGVAPRLVRSGGTIPVVDILRRRLGVPVALMGFALPDDRPHAPNEGFALTSFFRGVETSICFLEELALAPIRRSAI
jgi:acetylornithine deacetylase/succinyl-diaminopimelate desuccinylase-like protein